MNTPVLDVLLPYRNAINTYIQSHEEDLGPPSPVRDACQYALETSGKRFRPALVMMVAEALGSTNSVIKAAIAVEYFHTASLIADDLPCMDDDSLRRDAPSTHVKFGESTALLATYALIASGYEAIALQSMHEPRLAAEAVRSVSRSTGLFGATGGQYFDLNPPSLSKDELERIMIMKTVTLFEISFVLGWLFGGGNPSLLNDVKQLAYHFGMAFQIADDIDDWDQDDVNLAKLLGADQAQAELKRHIALFFKGVEELKLNPYKFQLLAQSLQK